MEMHVTTSQSVLIFLTLWVLVENGKRFCVLSIPSLSSFQNLIHGTFSHTLNPNYEDLIEWFKKVYMANWISVTSKAHIPFHHLDEYLNITGYTLALDGEQSLNFFHFLFALTH